LLIRHIDTIPQAIHLQLLTGGASVDILDVVGGGLEVAGGVVALGDEEVVLGAICDRLVDGDRSTLVFGLVRYSCLGCSSLLTMNCSSILPRRSRPGCSSRWWLADDSAIVETMAIQ